MKTPAALAAKRSLIVRRCGYAATGAALLLPALGGCHSTTDRGSQQASVQTPSVPQVGDPQAGDPQAGAAGPSRSPDLAADASAEPARPRKKSEPERQIEVTLADRSGYDRRLERHRGHVVLVDFWATWCAPCIVRFPQTVAAADEHGPELRVVSVSLDAAEDRLKVLAYLRNLEANFDNLLADYRSPKEAFAAFEIEPASIPHYRLYDRKGKLRHSGNDIDRIEPLIHSLIAE